MTGLRLQFFLQTRILLQQLCILPFDAGEFLVPVFVFQFEPLLQRLLFLRNLLNFLDQLLLLDFFQLLLFL